MSEEQSVEAGGGTLRTTLLIAAATAVGVLGAALILRDQVNRHRRNLFSPFAIRRLAALQHISEATASVDDILLLRDFIQWEERGLLRGRAQTILRRMEEEVVGRTEEPVTGGVRNVS